MTMLSSEIIRWIQGLDLAYSVQNVKHDFCNGFLVAEIFSRYYDNEVSMHSFSNGMNTTMRADNWRQLLDIFDKLGFELDNNVLIVQNIMNRIDGTLAQTKDTSGRDNRGITYLLERVYEFLTNRKICSKIHEKAEIPRKAKSRAVKGKRSKELDQASEESKMEETLPRKQVQDSDYSSSTRTPRVMKGETRTVERVSSAQKIVVQKIDIKDCKKNVSKYRSSKALRASLDGKGGQNGFPGEDDINRSMSSVSRVAEEVPENILDELISFSASRFSRVDRTTSDYLQGLYNKQLTADYVKCVLEGIIKQVTSLAEAIISYPTHYAVVSEVLTKSIPFAPAECIEALGAVGKAIHALDMFFAYALYQDYVLPALKTADSSPARFTTAALVCLKAHCPLNRRTYVQGLELIQVELNGDVETMGFCLATAVSTWRIEEEIHPAVLDWMKACASSALGKTSGKVRAAGLLLLRYSVQGSPKEVMQQVQRVTQLLDDREWEVQVQAVLYLQRALEGSDGDRDDLLKRISLVLSTTKAPEKLAYVFVLAFSRSLTLSSEIAQLYVEKLLYLCKDTRWTKDVFAHVDQAVLPFPSSLDYSFPGVYSTWDFPTLLSEVEQQLLSHEHKTAALRLVLGISGGLLLQEGARNASNTLDRWEEFYNKTVQILFDCVTSVETHSLALGILETLSMSRYGDVYAKRIIQTPLWIPTLSEVYGTNIEPIPDNTTETLCRLMQLNEDTAVAGRALIEELEQRDQLPPPRHFQQLQRAVRSQA